MSNAAAPVALLFAVIRRCAAGECERGCNCDVVPVEVDVDELTAVEVAHFQARGTASQRAEILSYFAPEASMSKPVSKCCAPAVCCPNATPGYPCNCSECRPWETTCPPDCPCLACLVDGLAAAPPPRVKAA